MCRVVSPSADAVPFTSPRNKTLESTLTTLSNGLHNNFRPGSENPRCNSTNQLESGNVTRVAEKSAPHAQFCSTTKGGRELKKASIKRLGPVQCFWGTRCHLSSRSPPLMAQAAAADSLLVIIIIIITFRVFLASSPCPLVMLGDIQQT
jgi:hypothetical protein